MSQTYYAILTNAGEAKLANAIALGVPLKLTHMGVGDGNGKEVTPDPTMTTLPGEQRRAAINTLFADPLNAAQLVAEQVIPADEGGWWVRCVGLYDEAGTLVAIANTPASFKPLLTTGAGRTQVIRMVLIVSNTAAVELKIDPAVVLATRKYCDDKMAELLAAHAKSRAHPEASITELGMVRKATDVEALAGQSLVAMMSSKNVADAVKNMLQTLFAGIAFPWPTATPPDGFIALTGQAINQATDPLLYARFGTKAPDMRGEVPRGWDNGRGVDAGRALLSAQLDQIQNITGQFTAVGWSGAGGSGAFSGGVGPNRGSSSGGDWGSGSWTFDASRMVRAGAETRMRNIAWNYITMRG